MASGRATTVWASVAGESTRRRHLIAMAVLGAAAVASIPSGPSMAWAAPVAVAGYVLGRSGAATAVVLSGFATVAGAATLGVVMRRPDFLYWMAALAAVVLTTVFPWLLGRTRSQRLALVATGWERAAQLEREAHLVGEEARLRERSRIAADMHDSLGHDLALLALRAGALEVGSDLSAEQRRAIAGLRADAARATARLGDIVGVLARDGDQVATTPRNERITEVVERARRAGLEVTAHVDDAVDTDDGPIGRAAHRIVQEALTNAARHAPGARVEAWVEAAPPGTVVRVVNDAPAAPPAAGSGAGTGLPALHERARLVGGSLRSGPTPDGGYEVAASLPRPQDAPHAIAADGDPGGGGTVTSSYGEAAFGAARRRARRSLAVALAVPVLTALVLAGAVASFWAYEMSTTVLDSGAYRAVRMGEPLSDAGLPSRHVSWGDEAPQPPRPEGTTCRYYRSGRRLFEAEPLYRICHAGGVVVDKVRLEPVAASR